MPQNRMIMAEGTMITDNLLAAFLDGNVSGNEVEAILQAAATDSALREFLAIAGEVSDPAIQDHNPLSSLAASSHDGLCAVHCERYALQYFGIARPLEELLSFVRERGIISDGGTPLAHVGKISAHYGLTVNACFASGPEDIESALNAGRQVIAAVDVGELDPSMSVYEALEDRIIGPRPDHCVVVLVCDLSAGEIICYDPSSGDLPVTIPVNAFLDAWKDSDNYMVVISE